MNKNMDVKVEVKISELFDYGDEIAVTNGIDAMFDPTEIKEITMSKIHETTARPAHKTFRPALIAAAAAGLLLALGITAYATGWAQSFIGQIPARYAVPDAERDAFLEKAGELSNKEPETALLTETEIEGESFTLEESYYDGENLMLVYSLDALIRPVEFGYGPGGEHFDELYTSGADYVLAFQPDDFTPEDFEKVLELQRGTEPAGFIWRQVYIGDHIRLTDGTDVGPMVEIKTEDGKIFLQNQNPLPEALRDRDELELSLYVKEGVMYYYKDGALEYTYCPVVQGEPVTFTIPNCG